MTKHIEKRYVFIKDKPTPKQPDPLFGYKN